MVPSRVGGLLRGRNPSPLVTPSSAALCGFFCSVLGSVWLMLYPVWPSGKACTSFVLYSNKDLLQKYLALLDAGSVIERLTTE